LRFSQVRTATPVQQIAPRKITGAENVTRKAVLSNGTIELSQARFQRGPEMQQGHLRGEMDFRVHVRASA
jgi:hypothetical protein